MGYIQMELGLSDPLKNAVITDVLSVTGSTQRCYAGNPGSTPGPGWEHSEGKGGDLGQYLCKSQPHLTNGVKTGTGR